MSQHWTPADLAAYKAARAQTWAAEQAAPLVDPGGLSEDAAQRLLGEAAAKGDLDGVKRALRAGADVNEAVYECDGWMGGTCTAMYVAVYGRCGTSRGGHTDVLQFLVAAAGADVELGDADDGFTPCLVACYKGYAESVRVLLALGADPNRASVEGGEGETPCMRAAVHGHVACLEALRAGGPGGAFTSVDAVGTGDDFEGKTALDLAEECGYDAKAVAYLRDELGARHAAEL